MTTMMTINDDSRDASNERLYFTYYKTRFVEELCRTDEKEDSGDEKGSTTSDSDDSETTKASAEAFIKAIHITITAIENGKNSNEMSFAKGMFLFYLKDNFICNTVDIYYPSDRQEKDKEIRAYIDKIDKEVLQEYFSAYFIQKIEQLLLYDPDSYGDIDEDEARWLRGEILRSTHVDKIEQKLIKNLKRKSLHFPEALNIKEGNDIAFDHGLFASRYLCMIAVICCVFSSLMLFGIGAKKTVMSFKAAIDNVCEYFSPTDTTATQQTEATAQPASKGDDNTSNTTDKKDKDEDLTVQIISSIDTFLFALVLLILGMGTYELFISKIDLYDRNKPSWLEIDSVDKLKAMLGKVIIMALIVTFFKRALEMDFNGSYYEGIKLVLLALSIFFVSLTQYLVGKPRDNKEVEEKATKPRNK